MWSTQNKKTIGAFFNFKSYVASHLSLLFIHCNSNKSYIYFGKKTHIYISNQAKSKPKKLEKEM